MDGGDGREEWAARQRRNHPISALYDISLALCSEKSSKSSLALVSSLITHIFFTIIVIFLNQYLFTKYYTFITMYVKILKYFLLDYALSIINLFSF